MIATLLQWFVFVYWVLSIPFFANIFEWNVRPYDLPNLLSGMETISGWEEERRPNILALFEKNVYGALPKEPVEMDAEILEQGIAFEGTDYEAYRKQIALTLSRADRSVTLQLLIYTPVQCLDIEHHEQGECSAIFAFNPFGNHSLTDDSVVLPSVVWSQRVPGVIEPFEGKDRGAKSSFFPVEKILLQGYAAVTLYYGDIDPDYDDGFKNGVHALFPEYAPGSWGSISAWSWGMSRVMDYLEDVSEIDTSRVAIFGFSRLGKAALWAAANDTRFAAVISDSAGEGGDTLSRRNFGESIRLMTLRFPHWFPDSYKAYAGREDELPVDQHQLLALIAPRPLLVSAGAGDWWSDPKGSKAAVDAAQEAYTLYRSNALAHTLHSGGHEVTQEEWDDHLTFLDKHFRP